MTQRLLEGISYKVLTGLLQDFGAKQIFLVTGKGSYGSSGAQAFIESELHGFASIRFSDFEQNPKFEDAVRGEKIFTGSNCDIIVAIGGGSVMDMAKLINCFAANPDFDPLDITKGLVRPSKKGKIMIAIPTTAGTGSEATHFAVVYHDKKKYSVAHKNLLPDIAALNHEFTMSQSSYLTACAGMDALSQAIESYWSVGGTETSKAYAADAIRILTAHLSHAVNRPNAQHRKAVLKAAFLAGKAINISKTTAAHAVSYGFTTYYDIPHGHAVFLTLPEFFEYNSEIRKTDYNDPRGADYTKRAIDELCALLGVKSASEGKIFLERMASEMGIELSLSKLGVVDYKIKIADSVNMERMGNNPRKISRERLISLLKDRP